jgi:DNA-binding response OmpR family regulator
MRVMVAEDDPRIQVALKELLEKQDFVVDVCSDGRQALEAGLANEYHAVVLDPGLPTFSGEYIIKRWNEKGRRFPILVYTGTRNEWEDIKEFIEAGISQHMAKPGDYRLLVEWVKSLARTAPRIAQSQTLRQGKLEMDIDNGVVRFDSKRVRMPDAEFAVLRELMLSGGQPMTCKAIAARVYGEADEANEAQVRTNINRIRDRVSETIIVNVSNKRGYMLA